MTAFPEDVDKLLAGFCCTCLTTRLRFADAQRARSEPFLELDPEGVRGYGVYPGGQSGNPGSKTYDQFVETWRTGELYDLQFLNEKPVDRDGFPLMIRFE